MRDNYLEERNSTLLLCFEWLLLSRRVICNLTERLSHVKSFCFTFTELLLSDMTVSHCVPILCATNLNVPSTAMSAVGIKRRAKTRFIVTTLTLPHPKCQVMWRQTSSTAMRSTFRWISFPHFWISTKAKMWAELRQWSSITTRQHISVLKLAAKRQKVWLNIL